jgi:hypothetical protein
MIRLLLRAYPAAWRAEYGEEMRLVILSKRITLSVIFNVLWNGYKQRMLDAGPMRTCLIGSIVTAIFAMECFERTALVRWVASLIIIVAFNGWAACWSRRSGKSIAQSWLVVLGSGYMANWFCATTFIAARTLIFAVAAPTLGLEIAFLVVAMLTANILGASVGFALARCESPILN